ncbi:MAG: threonine dehydratase [Gammaproteobacteria bacterium]|nr:threonine dehydratase [Gammaproteobacteria bacterium]
MFTLEDLDATRDLLRAFVAPTPQHRWPLLADALGCDVWVKHENHTPTGAFKARGGVVYLAELAQRRHPPVGLITATRGNHGQSIPFAAAHHHIPVTVLVPEGNSAEKNAAMAAWGATVEIVGADFDDARQEAEQRSAKGDLELVPSFHEHIIRGVATYAFELFSAVEGLDTVYVPIGMGSGICALIAVRDLLGLKTEIIGVVSKHADAVARSVEAGRVVETDSAATFVDGIACRVPHADALAVISRGAARIVRVSDDEVAAAVRLLYFATHNVAEGAGAAACAALDQDREAMRGKRVAVILTGGNIDTEWLATILGGGTPNIQRNIIAERISVPKD